MTELDAQYLSISAVKAAVLAFISNFVVVYTAQQVYAAPAGYGPFTAGAYGMASIIAAIGATVVFAAKKHWCNDYKQGFLHISAAVLTLSFITIFTLSANLVPNDPVTAIKTATTLGVMHVVTGWAITATLLERDRVK